MQKQKRAVRASLLSRFKASPMATKGLPRAVQQQAANGNVADAETWQRPSVVRIVDVADLRVDMLSCKICLGQYNTTDQRPRALVCQHTFCERCIRECLTKPTRVGQTKHSQNR